MADVKKILFIIIFLAGELAVCAQDLHFSQFYNSPLSINPANTGFMPDADFRIGAQYRNQWSSIMVAPYKTFSIFGDAQILRDKFENGWMGLGGLILSDVAGSGSLRSTKIYVSLAYHQMLGEGSLLSGGFNLGWANKRIDMSKLKFPDQFDGKFFDNTLPTSVELSTNNVNYFDMQAGLNYAYFPDEKTYINCGYSIHHVNRPVESFFSDDPDSSRIAMRHIGFVNALFKLNDRWIVNPHIFYTTQAKAQEIIVGMKAHYNLSDGGNKELIAGMYYRPGDALVPVVGFKLGNINLTFSYDVTTSSLKDYNNTRGANEFSIMENGFYSQYNSDSRKVLCPKF